MDQLDETLKKGEYKTITPPDTLQKKVRKLVGRDADVDPVAKAEQAVERLSVNFASWMEEEVARLIDIWQTNKAGANSTESRARLYRAAHDMRGQAATLGFPSVGRIAGVFCDILDVMGDETISEDFLEQYISAIRAIAHETSAGEDNSIAEALAQELSRAGNELIERHKPAEQPTAA